MTHTDAAPRRKPSRLGLYVPYLAAVLLIAGWSAAWVGLSGETGRRLDAGVQRLRADGWTIGWSARRIGGYPFRLDVDFTGFSLAEPSGWGISAPTLKTEAYAFAPTHWIAVAPQGVTLSRPSGGPVRIAAQALRASLSGWGQRPPRLSVEGVSLGFATAPGARPFLLTSARGVEIHTLAGPDDQGAIFVGLDQASAPFSGLMGRIADGEPVDLKADGIFSHASAVAGRDWPAMVRNWTRAGGVLQLRQMTVRAGQSQLDARAGALSVDDDGRLAGLVTASLGRAPPAASDGAVATQNQGTGVKVTFAFKDGETMLGGTPLFPAPRVF